MKINYHTSPLPSTRSVDEQSASEPSTDNELLSSILFLTFFNKMSVSKVQATEKYKMYSRKGCSLILTLSRYKRELQDSTESLKKMKKKREQRLKRSYHLTVWEFTVGDKVTTWFVKLFSG